MECVFQRRKSVYLATRSSDAEILRKESAARRSIGIDVEYWDESEVASRFSFSRPAALRSSQAAELDCHRLTHALLARAATSGASIFDRTLVEQYDAEAGSVCLRTDRGCKITAGHAVFATGYEAEEFLPKRIVKLKSTYSLASEPLDAMLEAIRGAQESVNFQAFLFHSGEVASQFRDALAERARAGRRGAGDAGRLGIGDRARQQLRARAEEGRMFLRLLSSRTLMAT